MKKQNTIIILAVLLAIAFYGYRQNWLGNKETIENKQIESETENNSEEKKEKEPGGNEDNIESKIDIQQAINYIAHNIAEISPINPVLGGSWHITRVWAVEETAKTQNILAYAEYEDGHIMNKVLTEVFVGGSETQHRVKAVFEPGEADWKLIEGEDIAFGKNLILYEKDENGNWITRKNNP